VILYLDSSALVKRYFDEEESEEVISLWISANALATSAVAYAECLAAVGRKARETALNEESRESIEDAFRRDWAAMIRLDVTRDVDGSIDRLAALHPLRGFDLIHLASALTLRERRPQGFLFACFDDRLLTAARQEGLETFPTLNAPMT
jgi:uncharacterized protein